MKITIGRDYLHQLLRKKDKDIPVSLLNELVDYIEEVDREAEEELEIDIDNIYQHYEYFNSLSENEITNIQERGDIVFSTDEGHLLFYELKFTY